MVSDEEVKDEAAVDGREDTAGVLVDLLHLDIDVQGHAMIIKKLWSKCRLYIVF